MKPYILPLLLLFMAPACFGQGTVCVDISSFRQTGDSLEVGYRVQVPARAIETGRGVRISPSVQTRDSLLELPAVTLLGNNKQKVLSRYRNNNHLANNTFLNSMPGDTSLVYSVRVPYQLWMDSARLVIGQEVSGYRGARLITRYRMDGRVELEPHAPYLVMPRVAFCVPEKEEKRRKRQGKAYLDFQAGRSVILPGFRRNPEELQKIDEAVREVVSNPDATLLGLYIEGYASPDGLYATNERLAKERAQALKGYIRSKFNLDEGLFMVSSVAEDWDGLEVLVKAGDMPQKDKILEIISTTDIFDGREAALMKLDKGVPYRSMLRDMFPGLRRVEYQLDYSVRDYDTARTLLLLEKNPADLSQFELYNLALSYGKDSPGFNRLILETIPRYFPEDRTAAGNAAAILITNGELQAAKRYLEKAGDSPQALNNLGAICLLEGELDKAEGYFKKAQQAGCGEAALNLEQVWLKREDNRKMERYQNRK